MMWGEHLSRSHWEFQKTVNDNNYCYLNTNPHCVKENNSYVHNLPTYNDRLAVNILEVDNKKHDYVKNEYNTENKILDHTGMNSSLDVSKPISTSPCNNLYVSPPFFTVDKFVNMDQTNHRDSRQIIQPTRNHNNQKDISNISLEYKIPESSESFLINNKNLIGIQVIEDSHIPLMHFETSDRPVRLNVPKQYAQEPVITEICNYEKNLLSYGSETFQKRKKPYSTMDYVQDSNLKNDFVRNQLLSIHHPYSGESIIKVESQNVYRMADLGTTIESSQHRIVPNDFQCMEFQRNSLQNGYAKSCITPAKNLNREKRKPNYREMINNAHALRSSISENDLNMQIIKRTLNYKQLPACSFPSRNTIPIQSLKRNNDNLCQKTEKVDVYDKRHANHLFNQQQDDGLVRKKPNIASPLDLSIKSIKTEANFDKKKSYEALIIEKGCPPKYNFEPNFLEKHNFMRNNLNSSRLQSNQQSVIRYNSNSSRPAVDFKLEQNLFHQTPKPEVKEVKIVNQLVENHLVDKLTGIELEVNRKRAFPVENFDQNKYLIKKKCLKSSYCASLNTEFRNFDDELEKKTDDIRNVQIKTTNNREIGVGFDQTTIKPEPELELELEPKLEPELEPELKPELKSELKPELKPELEPLEEPELKPEVETESLIIEFKQDVSSSFAARIRTKAELKGFVFQEEGADVQSKNLELKNCLDLCAWSNTCDKFVDQLDHCFEKTTPKTASSKVLQCSMPNVHTDSENESLKSSNLSPKRLIKRVKTDKLKLPTNKKCPVNLDVNCDDEKSNENTELMDNVVDSVSTQLMDTDTDTLNSELKESVNDCVDTEQINSVDDAVNTLPITPNPEERCKLVEENVSKDISKDSAADKQVSSTDSLSICNQKTPINITTRIFDLTKVSVVRLKREKYVSRILKQSDEPISVVEKDPSPENKKNDNPNKCKSLNLTLPTNPASDTQFELRNTDNSYTLPRGRPPKLNKVSKTNSSNLNNIKTRLRTQALESKKDSAFKNKKTIRRYENKSESELPSNTEKIYLEVYRYKRALKIPPNLITIKSKCVQKISKSIADSDIDPKITPNKNGESTKCFELNQDNVPKSIIDVLHSRVVKGKHHQHHNKFTQKYVKNERQHVSKSKLQQFNCSKSNSDQHQQILNENNNVCIQEKRNVFETQVIPSRTRREHKMQLSKETIREVFRGNERPSSAPPQINTLEDIYDKNYNDQCIKYFQKLSLCAAESDLQKAKKTNCQNGEHEKTNIKLNCSNKLKVTEQAAAPEEDNQCNNNNSNKSKRKRKRRIYKRRISSGFDYLRKKKRANTCALRNYSRFKRRKSTNEDSFPFRNESDILKEIQKWVLNKGVGQSALHKAATLGYIDVIVYCLEKMGLHPDHKDNAGYTPLHDACVNGSLDIARVLLQYGANHSESAHSGIRPIHEASENGHIEIVRMLLSYGADPLLETYSGQTPLMLASDPKVNSLISMHLNDVQLGEKNRTAWSFQGPWKANDENENECNVFNDIPSSIDCIDGGQQKRQNFRRDFRYFQNNAWKTDGKEHMSICNQNPSIKNIFCDFEFLYDAANAEGELFEFEEADSPLPPLYLLKDEGMEKWVLLSDLCSLLKVKSKDTLLHKIFPSVSPSHVSRAFLRELKMCEFLERATCLQLLCAGEKINICHSKVVLIRYNENVRNLLGVKTIIMKL